MAAVVVLSGNVHDFHKEVNRRKLLVDFYRVGVAAKLKPLEFPVVLVSTWP